MGTYYYQNYSQYTINIIYLVELDKKFKGTPADDVEELIWVPIKENPKFGFPYLQEIWKLLQNQSF